MHAPFPLIGVGCITLAYARHAVVDLARGRFSLPETLVAMGMEDLQAITGTERHTDWLAADLVHAR